MATAICIQPGWYRALTLAERLHALRADAHVDVNNPPDPQRADQRLQRWRAEKHLAEPGVWAQRLAAEGISEAELRYLLGEPEEDLAQRSVAPPEWLQELLDTYADAAAAAELSPSVDMASAQADFLALVRPLIHAGQQQLRDQVYLLQQRVAHVPLTAEQAVALCTPLLEQQLNGMLTGTMLLELHVARLRRTISGDDSHQRFHAFFSLLAQPVQALAILAEYPVLARQVMQAIARWRAVNTEFLERLYTDWDALQQFSPDGQLGTLVKLEATGDSHRDGHRVMVLTFAHNLRVVYKPRPFDLDAHFQNLLAWLNQQGTTPAFYTLRYLNRRDYGWVEYVSQRTCTSPEQVERFYQRQGNYLAVMYLLAITDAHFGNIIAMGEYPIFVDSETIFHSHFMGGPASALTDATDAVMDTVLRTGLLPHRSWGNRDSPGADTSGLSTEPGQLSPRRAQYYAGVGTDMMRVERRYEQLPVGANRPTLNGAPIELLDYRATLAASFARMYQLLLAQRAVLLAEGGPLAPFLGNATRVILRPTHLYSLLSREGYHPDLLRDALARERFFDRLWGSSDSFHAVERIVGSERAALWRDDIPLFRSASDTCDIWGCDDLPIPEFFPQTGMQIVRQRVAQLSEADLHAQLWCIDATFATLAMSRSNMRLPAYRLEHTAPPATADAYLAGACAVGDHLLTLALRQHGEAAWIGLSAERERFWKVSGLSWDLYSGHAGIALFLAYLGAQTGVARYSELAQEALAFARRQITQPNGDWAIGGFGHYGGMIYALCHLARLWNRRDLLDQASDLAAQAAPLVAADPYLDVLNGSAGLLAAMLCLHQCVPTSVALGVAERCAQVLLEQAQPAGAGLGWRIPGEERPLTGFSHGAAGIAWALLGLHHVQAGSPLREAALAALAFERGQFDPDQQNWRDLRFAPDLVYSFAWCHGAPGIGLSRLALLPWLDGPVLRSEIRAALAATRQRGFGHNHGLCHGDGGNLQFLLQAQQRWPELGLQAEIERLGAALLASTQRDGWLCGVPLGVETPGLMDGLAGIGYGLLRLAAPQQVPLVLLLEAPQEG